MKIKIQITIESDEGKPEALQEVAQLNRGSLRPESLGLTLAEARSILAGIEQTVVERQAAEFVAQQRLCSACGQERSYKGRHQIVLRTPFGKLKLESPRLYRCQCESEDRKSFSPLAALLPERTHPELVYLETKFAALVSYGLTVELLKEVLPIARTLVPRQFGSGYGKRPNGWKTNWGKSATFSLMAASKTGMSFQSRPYRLSLGSMAVMSMQKTNGREPKDGSR